MEITDGTLVMGFDKAVGRDKTAVCVLVSHRTTKEEIEEVVAKLKLGEQAVIIATGELEGAMKPFESKPIPIVNPHVGFPTLIDLAWNRKDKHWNNRPSYYNLPKNRRGKY